ncbi:hypothetical protein BCR36DRAFT_374132 [Piromyces finnis]|uniref:HMG box domain-containing protein n=1 Tax=Piromyces finnis TaxID=1754191 RepID=A0A1Y1UYV4_9FUNG|nr:hypothetical protein BCR36DRAFT_374132 [Piromyces finnis]|eukprot:ORX43065.1 hypothetical protein BCR36DRAFT_374132 [Piromyces finnis]
MFYDINNINNINYQQFDMLSTKNSNNSILNLQSGNFSDVLDPTLTNFTKTNIQNIQVTSQPNIVSPPFNTNYIFDNFGNNMKTINVHNNYQNNNNNQNEFTLKNSNNYNYDDCNSYLTIVNYNNNINNNQIYINQINNGQIINIVNCNQLNYNQNINYQVINNNFTNYDQNINNIININENINSNSNNNINIDVYKNAFNKIDYYNYYYIPSNVNDDFSNEVRKLIQQASNRIEILKLAKVMNKEYLLYFMEELNDCDVEFLMKDKDILQKISTVYTSFIFNGKRKYGNKIPRPLNCFMIFKKYLTYYFKQNNAIPYNYKILNRYFGELWKCQNDEVKKAFIHRQKIHKIIHQYVYEGYKFIQTKGKNKHDYKFIINKVKKMIKENKMNKCSKYLEMIRPEDKIKHRHEIIEVLNILKKKN